MLSDLVSTIISIDFDEIIDYDFPLDEAFGLEIIKNNIKYDFIIRLASNNENLICFGSGAQARNQYNSKNQLITPPFLNRWSWYNHFDESVIAYADPTFFKDENITLGWYVGGEEWYLETISQIIQKICLNQNIKQNNILFYGSSGGGFASIALATLIKNSKALVNNSSFDVRDITEQHYINLIKFLENEFNLPKDEILEKIDYRLNLNKLFTKMEYVPEMAVYINIYSPLDMGKRSKTFLEDLFKNPFFKNNLNINYYYDSKTGDGGHDSRIHGNEIKIVDFFVKAYLYNDETEIDPYLKLTKENGNPKNGVDDAVTRKRIDELNKLVSKRNSEIKKLINDFNKITLEYESNIKNNKAEPIDRKSQIQQLTNELKVLRNEINDKDSKNHALEEQIILLKSINEKKDAIIKSKKLNSFL